MNTLIAVYRKRAEAREFEAEVWRLEAQAYRLEGNPLMALQYDRFAVDADQRAENLRLQALVYERRQAGAA